MTANPSNDLRALRLWHWQQMVQCRELAKNTVATTTGLKQNALADKHLGFVQVLNDLFMAGDTAEADAARDRAVK